MRQFVLIFLVACCFSFHQPALASIQITEENRTALTNLNPDPNFQSKLTTFFTLWTTNQASDEKIKLARNRNNQLTEQVLAAIRQADVSNVSKYEKIYNNVLLKHDKILTTYKKLTQQYASLKLLKNSAIKKTVQSELDILRPAVYLARGEISRSLKQLQGARKARLTRVASLRNEFQQLQSKKNKLLTSRSLLIPSNQLLQAEWKSLIKLKDPTQATVTLSKCFSLSTDLVKAKETILTDENQLETELRALLLKSKP